MIFGVDPGLANVGWCLLNHGALTYGHIETAKGDQTGDAAKRLAEVMYGLSAGLKLLAACPADLARVVIEWPGGGFGGPGKRCPACGKPPGNPLTGAQVATTAGAVYGAAYWLLRGKVDRILTPAPVSWRVALGKKWGVPASEESIHAVILERFPQLSKLKKKSQPHILDAVGLCLYGELSAKGPRP